MPKVAGEAGGKYSILQVAMRPLLGVGSSSAYDLQHLVALTRRRPSLSAPSFLISSFNFSILDSFEES